jgi:hypothetical protein
MIVESFIYFTRDRCKKKLTNTYILTYRTVGIESLIRNVLSLKLLNRKLTTNVDYNLPTT